MPHLYFPPQCPGIVKENEVRLAAPAIGEVPGAQILGVEHGPPLHPYGQLLPAQPYPLAAGAGQGEVHHQPLQIQRQPLSAVGGAGLLQTTLQAAAREGGTQQHHCLRRGSGVDLRHIEAAAVGPKQRRQLPDQGRPILRPPALRQLLQIQHHPGKAPPQTHPHQLTGQRLRLLHCRGLPVRYHHQATPQRRREGRCQQMGARPDAVGRMGQLSRGGSGLCQPVRCGGEIQRHVQSPLSSGGFHGMIALTGREEARNDAEAFSSARGYHRQIM